MRDSFFIGKKKRQRQVEEEEEETNFFDDDDDESVKSTGEKELNVDLYAKETADEKRRRLAQNLLDQMKTDITTVGINAEELDKELLASRLRDHAMEIKGQLFKIVSTKFDWEKISELVIEPLSSAHDGPVTCVVMKYPKAYSSSKDGQIVEWDLKERKKVHVFQSAARKGVDGSQHQRHSDHILCLGISSDGKRLASGGRDSLIHVWSLETHEHLKCFKQHRKPVTGIAFQQGTNQMFSSSMDRTIKLWNVNELSYVETLFGHQDGVAFVDSLHQERCVTVGLRDRTLRLYKVPEESQLVFRASSGGSIDVVRMIDEDTFVTGSDDGSLSLWNVNRKKPLQVINAHETSIQSIACIACTDLIVSGASDGFIRFWRLADMKTLIPLGEIKMDGFINALCINQSLLVAGVGKEPRLGRWQVLKTAKNRVFVIDFKKIIKNS